MARDTGKGSRIDAVTARTQSKNPKTGDYTKRDETPGSPQKGEFMDVKKDGNPSKASPRSRIIGGDSHGTSSMNRTEDTHRKAMLSTLWVFVMFNYLYADLLMMIMNPTAYQKAVARMSVEPSWGSQRLWRCRWR